jgi:hypothetical protein
VEIAAGAIVNPRCHPDFAAGRIAARLQGEGLPEEADATAADLRARWRRRGLRAFDAGQDAGAA